MTPRKFTCPVCGFPDLIEPHLDPMGSPTYAICPCCGVEFGYDDASRSHSELRAAWLANGAPWWSERQSPPERWSAETQLKAAGLDVRRN